jgi:hypothetical protein
MERLVFSDAQPHWLRITDLSPFARDRWDIRGEWRLATHADDWPLLHHRIGQSRQMLGFSAMAQLPTWLSAALLAQAARLASEPVA